MELFHFLQKFGIERIIRKRLALFDQALRYNLGRHHPDGNKAHGFEILSFHLGNKLGQFRIDLLRDIFLSELLHDGIYLAKDEVFQ